MTTPTPPHSIRAKIQGGFLLRKQQKLWKHHLKIYHGTRKAIRTACQHSHTNLQNHPDIQPLILLHNLNHPPLPTNPTEQAQWIDKIANIGQKTKIEAHKIIVKQTTANCKTAITKYRALLNIKPKTIHKTIFYPIIDSSLDCIQNAQGEILTKPQDIANEIYYTQQTSFQRQIPLCSDPINHPNTCQCAISKYLWHTQNDILLDKRGHHTTSISTQFTRAIYDNCVKRLTKGKASGPDNIPNDILKALPPQCQDLIFLFFQHCYKHKEIPTQ